MINKVPSIYDLRRDMPKHMMHPTFKKKETAVKEDRLSFAEVLKQTICN